MITEQLFYRDFTIVFATRDTRVRLDISAAVA